MSFSAPRSRPLVSAPACFASPWPPVSSVLGAIATIGTAQAVVTGGQCVQPRGGNSCTAGDVTFILVGLGSPGRRLRQPQRHGHALPGCAAAEHFGQHALRHRDVHLRLPGHETAAGGRQGYAYNGTRARAKPCARPAPRPTSAAPSTLRRARSTCWVATARSSTTMPTAAPTCSRCRRVPPATSTATVSGTTRSWSSTRPITMQVQRRHQRPGGRLRRHPDLRDLGAEQFGRRRRRLRQRERGAAGHAARSATAPTSTRRCRSRTSPCAAACSPTTVRTGAVNGALHRLHGELRQQRRVARPTPRPPSASAAAPRAILQFDTVAATPNGSYIFGQTPGQRADRDDGWQPQPDDRRHDPLDAARHRRDRRRNGTRRHRPGRNRLDELPVLRRPRGPQRHGDQFRDHRLLGQQQLAERRRRLLVAQSRSRSPRAAASPLRTRRPGRG